MSKWLIELDLVDAIETYQEDKNAQQFAIETSKRIIAFVESNQAWVNREYIGDELEDLAQTFAFDETIEEVNGHLNDLYELADSARIWVKTF